MRIGDKVRFLNEVGGGVVAKFLSQGTILVRDEDGFEIPVLQSQVVVVETNENNFVKKPSMKETTEGAPEMPTAQKVVASKAVENEEDIQERSDGNLIGAYLVFVPKNMQELSTTTFGIYFINDSNYYFSVLIACGENAAWQSLWQTTVEPNTKLYLGQYTRDDLKLMEHLSIQLFSWKQHQPFMLKPVYHVNIHLDMLRFYKLHEYESTPFFREQVLVEDIICDDEPIQSGKPSTKQTSTDKKETSVDASKKDIIKVDLHIENLLEDREGLSPVVLLNAQLTEFRTFMDRNIRNKGQRLVFVHGKGQTALREALLNELKRKYPTCQYQDASFREYGFGGTLVTIG